MKQNKQLKLLNVLFIVSLLLVLVFSYFLLKSYNQTVKLKQEVNRGNAALQIEKLRVDSLELNAIKTEENFNEELNELVNTINSLKNSPKALEETIEKNYNQGFETKEYQVGVVTLKINEKNQKRVRIILKEMGLTVQDITPLDSYKTPDWVAKSSTVFWYDKRNIILAQKLAKNLGNILRQKIEVRQGAGFGVSTADKSNTFKIHLIGR